MIADHSDESTIMSLAEAYPCFQYYLAYISSWSEPHWSLSHNSLFVQLETKLHTTLLDAMQITRLKSLMGPLPLEFLDRPDVMILAGGAALFVDTGKTTSDLDFFVFNPEKAIDIFQKFLQTQNTQRFVINEHKLLEIRPIHKTSPQLKIQLIFASRHATPVDVLASFDFTCNRAFLSSKSIHFTNAFRIANSTRHTKATTFVSQQRLDKIVKKGYKVLNPQMANVQKSTVEMHAIQIPALQDTRSLVNTLILGTYFDTERFHMIWDGFSLRVKDKGFHIIKNNAHHVVITQNGKRVPLRRIQPTTALDAYVTTRLSGRAKYSTKVIGPLLQTNSRNLSIDSL